MWRDPEADFGLTSTNRGAEMTGADLLTVQAVVIGCPGNRERSGELIAELTRLYRTMAAVPS